VLAFHGLPVTEVAETLGIPVVFTRIVSA
jgi:hypothetical protein